MTVNSSAETGRNEFMNFPWLKNRETRFRAYKFIIPGVTFQLFTGRGLSSGMRSLCIATSAGRFIFMSNKLDEINLGDMAKLLARARTVGDLR